MNESKVHKFAEPFLRKLGFEQLNQIQVAMWDAAEKGEDVLLLAPTGSGKTLAFILPILKNLDPELRKTQAVIIAPTRELAIQIHSVLKKMSSGFALALCYGGHSMREEKKILENNPQIIIATPGRCNDHIRKANLELNDLKIMVFDEFDKSLELGFQDDIKEIVRATRSVEQFLLTSATGELKIPKFLGISDPKVLRHINYRKLNKGLRLYRVDSIEKDKIGTLIHLLHDLGDTSTLVFLNYREAVERVCRLLRESGIDCDYFHGGLDQKDREIKLLKFRNGTTRLLVTTDLAARGLDIPLVSNVIHYQLPSKEEEFIHRNGRTARMEASGNAFVLQYSEDDLPDFIPSDIKTYGLSSKAIAPSQTKWITISFNRGKSDKIGKTDILGFLTKTCHLQGKDVGMIEIKRYRSYAAIARKEFKNVLRHSQGKKLKGRQIKLDKI